MPLLQAVLVGIVAVFLIINGVRMTSAGIADFQTRAFLADWETKAAEPNQRAWNVALQAATRAAAHYPVANGAYLERLGYVHAWLHFRHPPGDPTARAQRIVARDAYRAAISARPAWPYAWAALAQIKLGLLEFDEEFHHALAQAHAMAPWRAEVNRRVAEVGLIAWPQLLHFEQTFVIIAAARAIQHAKRHRAPLFSFARNAGQIEALCAALSKQGYRPNANECPTRPPSTASP